MNQLNIGVIGCGYWGPNLLRNFVGIPEVENVAAADLNWKQLDRIKGLYPHVEVTDDYRTFFDMGLDAVAIATPPATHFKIAKDCLENSVHTFVEKPITLCSQDAKELIELARVKRLTLMVGHTFEYNPAVRKMKEIISSGELGRIYYIKADRASLGLFQPDINVIWDLAPHDLSILLFLLDHPPLTVQAIGDYRIFPKLHDIAYMHLEFEGKVTAHLHLSWLDPCKVRRITIVGSQKMLVYDDVESQEKIRIYDKGVENPSFTETFGEFVCNYRYGDIVIPHIKFTEPLRIECRHFINCILDKSSKPISCGEQGLTIVQILEAAQLSLENDGQLYQLQYDEPSIPVLEMTEELIGE
ncbi:MAG: Gfo/Idh/MocA family protein [Candidatus Promineifilaceae bacterium]|jgi:predicted dehydrogenase